MKKQTRLGLVVGGLAVVVVVILYFTFMYPPPSGEDVKGTIGGVKKANKPSTEQITDKDVILKDTGIQNLLQNDKIVNLLQSKSAALKVWVAKLNAEDMAALGKLNAEDMAALGVLSSMESTELQAMFNKMETRK